MIATTGKYLLSFITQIFRNDLLNHCGDYDLMINTLKEMSFKIGYSIFVIRLNKCIRVLKQNVIP